MNPSLPELPVFGGAQTFLDAYESFARPVARKLHLAYWDFSITGDGKHQEVIQHCEEIFSDLHADTRVFEKIQQWLTEGQEPLVKRQLQLLFREYRRSTVPQALRKKIIALSIDVEETLSVFRPTLRGQRCASNDLDRILLRESDEALRRDAWVASRQVGVEVVERSVELVRLRNEVARALGFANYFELALDDDELEADWVEDLLSALEEQSKPAWEDCRERITGELALQRGKPASDLMPWDYPDRFFQNYPRAERNQSTDGWFDPNTIRRFGQGFFRRVGLPIEELWQAADMMPREGKNPHAFCIGIDNPSDVRVLCNLDGTTRWMDTTLHEFGHALYNRYIDETLPWLLREAAHTFVTEAVAMYFGRHARDPMWLREIVSVPEDRTRAVAGTMAENQLVFSRWALLVTRFEQGMYADPDQDLNALWWRLAETYQGLRRPAGHDLPDWAAKVHISCYPAYYQNYIYGELLASQFRDCITEGPEGESAMLEPGVGSFFRDLFFSGRSLPWTETVRRATGRDLDPKAWLEHFGGATP